jgi:hypothetical protein
MIRTYDIDILCKIASPDHDWRTFVFYLFMYFFMWHIIHTYIGTIAIIITILFICNALGKKEEMLYCTCTIIEEKQQRDTEKIVQINGSSN